MADTADTNKIFDNIRLADLDYIEKDIESIISEIKFEK